MKTLQSKYFAGSLFCLKMHVVCTVVGFLWRLKTSKHPSLSSLAPNVSDLSSPCMCMFFDMLLCPDPKAKVCTKFPISLNGLWIKCLIVLTESNEKWLYFDFYLAYAKALKNFFSSNHGLPKLQLFQISNDFSLHIIVGDCNS